MRSPDALGVLGLLGGLRLALELDTVVGVKSGDDAKLLFVVRFEAGDGEIVGSEEGLVGDDGGETERLRFLDLTGDDNKALRSREPRDILGLADFLTS